MVVLLAAVAVVGVLPGLASTEIRFLILLQLGAIGLSTIFTPLVAYLSQETGEKVSIIIPKDFAAFKTAVTAQAPA
jgi:hypothetical protein